MVTLQELLTLATSTLAQVPHHPAVTAELCAAICWQESTGEPGAHGDHDKSSKTFKAVGLAQFHEGTWKRFSAARFACTLHACIPTNTMHRSCARCSMGALINELSYAARRAPQAEISNPKLAIALMAYFHNSGGIVARRTAYVLRVQRAMKLVESAKSLADEPNPHSAIRIPKSTPRRKHS